MTELHTKDSRKPCVYIFNYFREFHQYDRLCEPKKMIKTDFNSR